MFATPINLNFKGRSAISTKIGAILTIATVVINLTYCYG